MLHRSSVNDAAHRFMSQHQVLDDVEHGHQAPISPVFHDSLGNLDEAALEHFILSLAGFYRTFITMVAY